MKKLIALIIVILVIQLEGLLAAPLLSVDSVGIQKIKGKEFIEYKVEEHEGWYAIARKYGIHYSDLRIANKDVSDTIHIGQVILVPTDKGKINDPRNLKNYTQNEKNEPLYHSVKKKETLFSIAKKYKVTEDEIKKWNQLKSGDLKKGEQLIVGYKKVKAKSVQLKHVEEGNEQIPETKSETRKDEPIIKISDTRQDSVRPIRTVPIVNALPDTQSVVLKPVISKSRIEVTEQGVATWIDDENINPNKYFALHRSAPIGGVVKVTNRMNKRVVFVKVVGRLPDTGDNDNIIIKISKASAEKLGVRDQRFQCDLAYGMNAK